MTILRSIILDERDRLKEVHEIFKKKLAEAKDPKEKIMLSRGLKTIRLNQKYTNALAKVPVPRFHS